MTDLEIAWIAGLFEGEGCIYRNNKSDIRLQIYMTDKDVLDEFARITGGKVTGPYLRQPTKRELETGYLPVSPRKEKWSWTEARQDKVNEILTAMWPYLKSRRQSRAVELGYSPYRYQAVT